MKFLCLLFFIFSSVIIVKAQTIRYVKTVAVGSGNGTSWAHASSSIQAMLNENGVSEVWVAAGTYKPVGYPPGCTNCTSSRDYAFLIPGGKKLIGGFAGTETNKNERNITVNVTTLSGDIGTPGVASDNTFHVVLSAFAFGQAVSVELDGFTVTGGNSVENSGSISIDGVTVGKSSGAGAVFQYGNKVIRNTRFVNNTAGEIGGGLYILGNGTNSTLLEFCSFSGNSATRGAGFYLFSGVNQVSQCVIENNTASGDGGGAYIYGDIEMENCRLSGNTSGKNGGGVYFTSAYPGSMSNCELLNNTATDYGAGVYTDYGNYEIRRSTFTTNTSKSGGGVYCYEGSQHYVRDNYFETNKASTYSGGGLHISGTDNITIERNFFVRNTGSTGGGLGISGSNSIIRNNAFDGNISGYGGGFIATSGTNLLVNNTFVNHENVYWGGSAVVTLNGTNTFRNNLFWGNKKASEANVQGAEYRSFGGTNTFIHNALQTLAANYTTTAEGTYHLGTGAFGNLFGVNPQLTNISDLDGADNQLRTADDGLTISANSPMKNAGNATAAPPDDIRGLTREGNADIGAYEYIFFTCPESKVVTGTINSDQKAGKYVTTLSANAIQGGARVSYQAGDYIQLNPGFSTGSNSTFVARIAAGCQ